MHASDTGIGGNLIFAALSPKCREFVEERSLSKPIVSGEVVLEPGAPIQSLIFPHDGQISIQYTMKEGRTAEMMSVDSRPPTVIVIERGPLENYETYFVTVADGGVSA